MKKILFAALAAGSSLLSGAQELYVFSEPASNIPARSISLRLSAMRGNERRHFEGAGQRYIPEVMLGINKNLMLKAGASFSNMYTSGTRWESVYLYGKYRFLSADDVHRHFRMAAFAEGAYARNKPYFDEISLQGDRSGIQAGIIATQLISRFAASATGSFTQTLEEDAPLADQSLNYSASAGFLILPLEYKNYRQLNLNIYAELIGQRTLGKMAASYIDLAPAIQFIFNSNSKLNLGYRFQLDGSQRRGMKNYFLVSFEHSFFNALKK